MFESPLKRTCFLRWYIARNVSSYSSNLLDKNSCNSRHGVHWTNTNKVLSKKSSTFGNKEICSRPHVVYSSVRSHTSSCNLIGNYGQQQKFSALLQIIKNNNMSMKKMNQKVQNILVILITSIVSLCVHACFFLIFFSRKLLASVCFIPTLHPLNPQ